MISIVGPSGSIVNLATGSPLEGPIPPPFAEGAYYNGSLVPKPAYLTSIIATRGPVRPSTPPVISSL